MSNQQNLVKVSDISSESLNDLATASSSSFMFRNKLINGNFDIWQRGTSFSASAVSQHLADRWINVSATTTQAVSRQVFSVGQSSVPGNPKYYHRSVVASASTSGSVANLQQRIEGVGTLANSTATLSFWAKADSAKNIAVEFNQYFGSGGSPSDIVRAISPTTIPLTASWQKFIVTANIPSIAGKTLGTNNDDYLQFNLWFDAGSDFNARTNSLGNQSGTFDIAQVQLEEGTVATPFEHRPIGLELSLCQRYYEKSYSLNTPPGTATTVGGVHEGTISDHAGNVYFIVWFKETKRVPCQIIAYSHTGVIHTWFFRRSGVTDTAITTEDVPSWRGENAGLLHAVTSVGALYVPTIFYGHYVANAEL